MLIRFTYADGTQRIVDVDHQLPARDWFAGNRFNVPVPSHPEQLVAVDTVIEEPHSRMTIRSPRLMAQDHVEQDNFGRSLVYALVLGLLILPVFYDLLFFRILRQSFIIWHLVTVGSMAAYTLLHSGLIYVVIPNLGLGARWWGMVSSFVFSVSSGIFLVRGLIERRCMTRRMFVTMNIAAIIPLALLVVSFVGVDQLRIVSNQLQLLGFIPSALMVLAVLLIALAKGSRGAIWAMLGLGGLVIVGAMRLLEGLDLYFLPFPVGDMIFAAMVGLSVFTTFGVGDRFLSLRRDRDFARDQAIRLRQVANTDGLTGLANRRAFDMMGRLSKGYGLLVVDVDRFKQVNDNHGHQVGDAVLCQLASVLRAALEDRPGARVFRLGGEEFAVIAEVGAREALRDLAEDLRKRVDGSDEMTKNLDLPPVTVSIGGVLGQGQLIHEAFGNADAALYRAKETGRNRTVIFPYDQDQERRREMRFERLGGG
ncbi:diguanylate cyclase [Erythrobacter sp.]|uniref:GGDEF domain-containing protein n=1 Tax=Erythrobacter sp. TaxID=1042 RepID=UPI001AFD1893|nr:diguanylate cyclase [Erythrobacter sp.]MBO6526263.1 diguanylate cyclase [Erythrobacter sp.]MBO6530516.1 diguanylate cyclase [Erythrobacter sp.]